MVLNRPPRPPTIADTTINHPAYHAPPTATTAPRTTRRPPAATATAPPSTRTTIHTAASPSRPPPLSRRAVPWRLRLGPTRREHTDTPDRHTPRALRRSPARRAIRHPRATSPPRTHSKPPHAATGDRSRRQACRHTSTRHSRHPPHRQHPRTASSTTPPPRHSTVPPAARDRRAPPPHRTPDQHHHSPSGRHAYPPTNTTAITPSRPASDQPSAARRRVQRSPPGSAIQSRHECCIRPFTGVVSVRELRPATTSSHVRLPGFIGRRFTDLSSPRANRRHDLHWLPPAPSRLHDPPVRAHWPCTSSRPDRITPAWPTATPPRDARAVRIAPRLPTDAHRPIATLRRCPVLTTRPLTGLLAPPTQHLDDHAPTPHHAGARPPGSPARHHTNLHQPAAPP